jgi:hypothetical protein
MSQIYVGVLVSLLTPYLAKIGFVGTDELTTTITTLVSIGGALWALFNRYKMGGVTPLGTRI